MFKKILFGKPGFGRPIRPGNRANRGGLKNQGAALLFCK
jgi:hypothetical protein